jgi:predicted enzyme related to lactoylglutathione lyase
MSSPTPASFRSATFEAIISILMEEPVPNPFCHVELNTTDVKKSKDFYSKLFDWKLEDMPGGDYTMIRVGDGTGGGMMKNPIPGAPSLWLAYVLVDDIQSSTKKAKSLGANVMKDVTEIPEFGWFSVLADPTGAHFALWKPKK